MEICKKPIILINILRFNYSMEHKINFIDFEIHVN
jgi:hypothetical protein